MDSSVADRSESAAANLADASAAIIFFGVPHFGSSLAVQVSLRGLFVCEVGVHADSGVVRVDATWTDV